MKLLTTDFENVLSLKKPALSTAQKFMVIHSQQKKAYGLLIGASHNFYGRLYRKFQKTCFRLNRKCTEVEPFSLAVGRPIFF
jgi:hypothetical protein